MSSDEKDRYIHYLVDKVNELSLDKRAIFNGCRDFVGMTPKTKNRHGIRQISCK